MAWELIIVKELNYSFHKQTLGVMTCIKFVFIIYTVCHKIEHNRHTVATIWWDNTEKMILWQNAK